MVMERLGLAGGGNHYAIRARIEELGLDASHFLGIPVRWGRSWTDDQLREAVRASTSFVMVAESLGLQPVPSAYNKICRRARMLALDTNHFAKGQNSRPRRSTKWTDEELRNAVSSSRSFAQTIRALGLIPEGGNYRHVQRRVDELDIDTSHFTGMGWNVGGKFRPRPALPLSEMLVAGRWAASHHLKSRLLREGVKKAACEVCGWAQQTADGRVPVELDHINGDPDDNRIENLRILCPNCHSLTPTYRGLNQRRHRAKKNL